MHVKDPHNERLLYNEAQCLNQTLSFFIDAKQVVRRKDAHRLSEQQPGNQRCCLCKKRQ